MYQLHSTAPASMRVKNILHIVDTREYDQSVKDIIARYHSESHQVFKLGATVMAKSRFNDFQFVMVHDTKDPLRFWEILKKSDLCKPLIDIAKSKEKMYIGVGNGAALLQLRMTYFKDGISKMTTQLEMPQLGVVNQRLLFHFDPSCKNKMLMRQILEFSATKRIWLFPDGTSYTSKDMKPVGEVYSAVNGKLQKVTSNISEEVGG